MRRRPASRDSHSRKHRLARAALNAADRPTPSTRTHGSLPPGRTGLAARGHERRGAAARNPRRLARLRRSFGTQPQAVAQLGCRGHRSQTTIVGSRHDCAARSADVRTKSRRRCYCRTQACCRLSCTALHLANCLETQRSCCKAHGSTARKLLGTPTRRPWAPTERGVAVATQCRAVAGPSSSCVASRAEAVAMRPSVSLHPMAPSAGARRFRPSLRMARPQPLHCRNVLAS